jgi:hypothetical protein
VGKGPLGVARPQLLRSERVAGLEASRVERHGPRQGLDRAGVGSRVGAREAELEPRGAGIGLLAHGLRKVADRVVRAPELPKEPPAQIQGLGAASRVGRSLERARQLLFRLGQPVLRGEDHPQVDTRRREARVPLERRFAGGSCGLGFPEARERHAQRVVAGRRVGSKRHGAVQGIERRGALGEQRPRGSQEQQDVGVLRRRQQFPLE